MPACSGQLSGIPAYFSKAFHKISLGTQSPILLPTNPSHEILDRQWDRWESHMWMYHIKCRTHDQTSHWNEPFCAFYFYIYMGNMHICQLVRLPHCRKYRLSICCIGKVLVPHGCCREIPLRYWYKSLTSVLIGLNPGGHWSDQIRKGQWLTRIGNREETGSVVSGRISGFALRRGLALEPVTLASNFANHGQWSRILTGLY